MNGQDHGLIGSVCQSLQILTNPEGSTCQVDLGNMWDRMSVLNNEKVGGLYCEMSKEQTLITIGLYV